MLTLSKSSLWYRRSCAACKLKLSSTLVNGQINKCKRATEANKNNSGSPKTVLFSAMTAEKKKREKASFHFRQAQEVNDATFTLAKALRVFFISRAFEKYYWNLILKKMKKKYFEFTCKLPEFSTWGWFFFCFFLLSRAWRLTIGFPFYWQAVTANHHKPQFD